MPDSRRHRGPDHADRRLFDPRRVADLRRAVDDLSWLLGRGYAEPSAIKLVGDRHQLRRRQREALRRASCAEDRRRERIARRIDPDASWSGEMLVDGFNVLIGVEAALSGAVLLVSRDGCLRDIASIHGSYRQVEETRLAIDLVARATRRRGIRPLRWLLDSPVSNSGRLKRLIADMAGEAGWDWTVELVRDPDPILSSHEGPVATSDSVVLDGGGPWIDLVGLVVEESVPDAWVVDLSAIS